MARPELGRDTPNQVGTPSGCQLWAKKVPGTQGKVYVFVMSLDKSPVGLSLRRQNRTRYEGLPTKTIQR